MSWNWRQWPWTYRAEIHYRTVFTGPIKFTHKGIVEIGEIFGEPFTATLIGPQTYHVRKGDRVYDIPAHAIQRLT